MILIKSPLRITFGGGGTDLPSFYHQYEGFLISATINKYIYISLNKPFEDYSYSAKNTNDYFIHFYTKHFLPFLLKTKNIQRSKYRELQPICLAFLDEHESKVSSQTYLRTSRFSERLHHHAILVIHADTLEKMQSLIGENTLASNKFSTKVMSSHVRECDPMCLLYASKMYAKYPDFLSFPDRLH
jgi:hypothetical protein